MAITPEDLNKPKPEAEQAAKKPTLAQMESDAGPKQRLAAYLTTRPGPLGRPINGINSEQMIGDMVAVHKFAGVTLRQFQRAVEVMWDKIETEKIVVQ